MKYCLYILAILVISGSAVAEQFNASQLGISFDISSDWQLSASDPFYVKFVNQSDSNYLLTIIRHSIPEAALIESDSDLKTAIKGFFNQFGSNYKPDDSLVYQFNNGVVSFSTKILNSGDPRYIMTHSYLYGLIARSEISGQLFFLIKFDYPENLEYESQKIFKEIVSSFQINEPLENKLYSGINILPYVLILLILVLIAFFYGRNRRIQRSKNPLGLDSNAHWRCIHCNLVNAVELSKCDRCGRERVKTGSLNR